MYTHTIFLTHIFVFTCSFLIITSIHRYFLCISPWIRHLVASKSFFDKNFMSISVLSWEIILYTHTIFNALLWICKPFFRNYTNSSIYCMYWPMVWRLGAPKKVLKNFTRIFVLNRGITRYTTFLSPISAFTDPFRGITHIHHFSCVLVHVSGD